MIDDSLTEKLISILGRGNVLVKEPMERHCSFRVGGPADYYLSVHETEKLLAVLNAIKAAGVDGFIMGRGTNLLIGDGGYRGAIITFTAAGARPLTDMTSESIVTCDTDSMPISAGDDSLALLNTIQIRGTHVYAGAGVSLAAVAMAARDHGLSGMEFAAGIPGSVGGGLVMNAGAYGGEMKNVVESAVVLMPTDHPDYRQNENSIISARRTGTSHTRAGIFHLEKEQLHFGYRTSVFKEIPAIALQAVFCLSPGSPADIDQRMQEFAEKRRQKQPLEYPSAGSTFKRPPGHFAGALIEESGLRGYTVGGACVSEKHCGFVINKNHATAGQIRQVISDVQKKVHDHTGILLEPEVIFLGEF